MKICTLTHTYPRFPDDINAPFVEKLMEHIGRKGNEVSVMTAYNPEWNRTNADHTVDLRTYRYIWPDSLHILGYSRTIEGNIRFKKRVFLLSPLLFACAYRSFLKLVHEKKPDILHAHWILPNGYIAAHVARITGIPLIIQTHGSDVFTAERNALFRSMARYAASRAHYMVVPSPEHTGRLGAIGIDTTKTGLVPNTVEADFSSDVTMNDSNRLKKKLGIPPDHAVVLAMGRMVYVKGFNYLIEAFQRIARDHQKVTLVLAGDGVLYEDIKEESIRQGIQHRVIMPGAVLRHEVPIYFAMADIFVVPSIRHESGAVDGLPVVVPEAMAAGLPIIASDISGIPVLVKDKYNGILVQERDADTIASAISNLLTDHQRRNLFGERSRQIIEKSVNYDTISDHFIHLYREIVGKRTPAGGIQPFTVPFE